MLTTQPHVQQLTLACLVTAESSTHQVAAALVPLSHWLSPLRPLVVSYGDDAAALLADGSRLVRRLGFSCDVGPGDAAIAYSLG